jgi:hypothetical protein
MPCDRILRQGQTISQRKKEIKKAVEELDKKLSNGQVKPVVGKNGAITFVGNWNRQDVADACAFRMIQTSGSAHAKLAIAKAEQMAGVKLNKQLIGQGVHSHDGGKTWHGKG